MDEKMIRLYGFDQSESDLTRSFIRQKLGEIWEDAPYGATIKAIFSRKKRSIRGVITIYSSTGRFFAAASGFGIKEVVRNLIDQIRNQLDKWKSSRFKKNNRSQDIVA